jgi:Cdc6-like AAA superfamily ATPase
VGRAAELAQLHDLLARVQRKRGPHLATVIGDPGVGKSRLVRQFEQELLARPDLRLERARVCELPSCFVCDKGSTVGPAGLLCLRCRPCRLAM